MSADDWINYLKLIPHPEGGYYHENYRNPRIINDRYDFIEKGETRNFSSSIFFLLKSNQVSKLHVLKYDEIFYFHIGCTIRVHIFNNGTYNCVSLGTNILKGEVLQHVIPAGSIFGADVVPSSFDFAIFGCAVSPGFDYKDFRLVPRDEMILSKYYLDNSEIINKLT